MGKNPKLDSFLERTNDVIKDWCVSCKKAYLQRKNKITMEIFLGMLTSMDQNISTNRAIIKLHQSFGSSAFCKFRDIIPSTACEMLWISLISLCKREKILDFNKSFFSVDGSAIDFPDSFESLGFKRDRPDCPVKGYLTTIIDLTTKIPVALDFSPSKDERAALQRLLPIIPKGSTIIVDRGYFGSEIITKVANCGIHFICRVKENLKIVKNRKRNKNDQLVLIETPTNNLKVRLITYLPSKDRKGTTIHLVTDLDASETYDKIKDLYHRRWDIEEFYKILKAKFGDNFHSRKENGILQELYISNFHFTLLRAIEFLNRDSVTEDINFVSVINSSSVDEIIKSKIIAKFVPESLVPIENNYIRCIIRCNILRHQKDRSFPILTKRGKTKFKYKRKERNKKNVRVKYKKKTVVKNQ